MRFVAPLLSVSLLTTVLSACGSPEGCRLSQSGTWTFHTGPQPATAGDRNLSEAECVSICESVGISAVRECTADPQPEDVGDSGIDSDSQYFYAMSCTGVGLPGCVD